MVHDFHLAYGLPTRSRPGFPDHDERDLRANLLKEEIAELWAAEANDDLTEVADALGDIVYIIYGTALAYGINLDAVVEEIHRSNMTKLDASGKPVYRADGKVLKSNLFQPPNLERVIYGD